MENRNIFGFSRMWSLEIIWGVGGEPPQIILWASFIWFFCWFFYGVLKVSDIFLTFSTIFLWFSMFWIIFYSFLFFFMALAIFCTCCFCLLFFVFLYFCFNLSPFFLNGKQKGVPIYLIFSNVVFGNYLGGWGGTPPNNTLGILYLILLLVFLWGSEGFWYFSYFLHHISLVFYVLDYFL